MSDPVNFNGNSTQTGGNLNFGPSKTGFNSRLASGQENISRLMPESFSSHTVNGNGKRPANARDAHSSIDFSPLTHGVASGMQHSNWRGDAARLVTSVFKGMQRGNYDFQFIFLNKALEKTANNSYFNSNAKETVYLEEIYTMTGLNFKLYIEQENLHDKARAGMGKASLEAQEILDTYDLEFMRRFALCGVCHNEHRYGSKHKTFNSPINLQKLIQTMWIGKASVFNVFGESELPQETPLYFLFKQVEQDEIPPYYQYTEQELYKVRDSTTDEQITENSGNVKFRPFQIIPYAKAGCSYPPMKDRLYTDSDGELREAVVIYIGRLHYNKDEASTIARLNADKTHYDMISTITQPQLVIRLDLKPAGFLGFNPGDNVNYNYLD